MYVCVCVGGQLFFEAYDFCRSVCVCVLRQTTFVDQYVCVWGGAVFFEAAIVWGGKREIRSCYFCSVCVCVCGGQLFFEADDFCRSVCVCV